MEEGSCSEGSQQGRLGRSANCHERQLSPSLSSPAFARAALDTSALSRGKDAGRNCFQSARLLFGLAAKREASATALPHCAGETPLEVSDTPDRGLDAEEEVDQRATLRIGDLPRGVLDCKYAVRGPTVTLANELSDALSRGEALPFSSLTRVNIGDPQALGQPPIVYYRQVLACLLYPPLVGLPLHLNSCSALGEKAIETKARETRRTSGGLSGLSSQVSTQQNSTCEESASLAEAEDEENCSSRHSPSEREEDERPWVGKGFDVPLDDEWHATVSSISFTPPADDRDKEQEEEAKEALRFLKSSPFPSDVTDTAKVFLSALKTVGAYTHSQGSAVFRQKVATFFARRDGHPASPEDVFLTDGASTAVALLIELLISDPKDGVLLPVPQYPLYQGLLTRAGGVGVGYFLDEERDWSVETRALRDALNKARVAGTRVKALVVINPGNPTGQVLPREKLQQVVRFCESERLVLIADEVYQENVYGEVPFTSLRKVALDMKANLSVVSLHSSSKGFVGECGLRGGCMLLSNVGEDVRRQIYKLASMSLCSNTLGQAAIALVCSPPTPENPSYNQFSKQKTHLLKVSRAKAQLAYARLNAIPGVSCRPIGGAVFCFPKITLPPRAEEEARAAGREPDGHFCLQLLRATGIVTVEGSGFGQRPGEWHIRICILPPLHVLDKMLAKFAAFYTAFCDAYSEKAV